MQTIPSMVETLHDCIAEGYTPLIVTARPKIMREATIAWVKQHIGDLPVYMTDSDKRRKDHETKSDIVDSLMETYDIVCAFDDKPANIAMFATKNILGYLV